MTALRFHAGVALLLAAGCQSSPSSEPPATSANANGALAAQPPPVVEPTAAPPAASPAPTAAPPPPSAAPGGTLTVAQADKLAAGAHGVVRGQFLGWSGPCRIDPPSRSAWMLGDGSAKDSPCLYVDGPLPPGVSPGAPPPAPVWVRVDAELRAAGPDHWLVAKDVTREGP